MSDAFYKDMATTALGVITDFQQGVLALERQTLVAGVEPWDPEVPTFETFPFVGVVQAVDRRYVDGVVVATDRMAIIPANSLPVSVVPSLNDRVLIDGVPTTIKRVIRIPEAGIVIVYRVVLGS